MEYDGVVLSPQGQRLPYLKIKGLRSVLSWDDEVWEGFILDGVLYFDVTCEGPNLNSKIAELRPSMGDTYATLKSAVTTFLEFFGRDWALVHKFVASGLEKIEIN
jgi:hypothetical protein